MCAVGRVLLTQGRFVQRCGHVPAGQAAAFRLLLSLGAGRCLELCKKTDTGGWHTVRRFYDWVAALTSKAAGHWGCQLHHARWNADAQSAGVEELGVSIRADVVLLPKHHRGKEPEDAPPLLEILRKQVCAGA